MKCTIDSKALSNFAATPIPRVCIDCTKTVPNTFTGPALYQVGRSRASIDSVGSSKKRWRPSLEVASDLAPGNQVVSRDTPCGLGKKH